MSDNNSGRNNKGPGGDGTGQRREPVFSDFDDDEEFEESERDTDYASTYEEDELEELDDDYDDQPDDYEADPDWQPASGSTTASNDPANRTGSAWDEDGPLDENGGAFPPVPRRGRRQDESEEDDYPDEAWDDEDYEVDEPHLEEDAYEERHEQGWPVGLIVVALVALVLLAAGGYGVIQQRAATQEEIRQLQAALATAAKPAELAASREAVAALEQASAEQLERIEALTLENRRLVDTVAGLESQLAALESSPPREPAAAAPTPKPSAAKPAAPKPAASSAATGDWFVNFSSYSQRSAADAWAGKLKPSAGKAIVQPGSRDGRTFYRVRIVNLADRAQAEQVARQLQQAHGLPKLWVGMEQ